jgi:large subunit ribosomal protein L4
MPVLEIVTASGKQAGSVQLPDEVFAAKINVPLIHQVVVAQLAAARQGTHSTKTRGEVRGGGRKPYRQKGTGRARQGSTRAPQFVGGGTVHGPKPRDYSQRTPKKMKQAALRGALSDRAAHDRIHVITGFSTSDSPSTKSAASVLNQLTDRRRVLVVAPAEDYLTWLSLRNLPQVHLLTPGQLNTYDVMVSDDVVFTQTALVEFLGDAYQEVAADAAPKAAKKATKKAAATSEESSEAAKPAKKKTADKAEAADKTTEAKAAKTTKAEKAAKDAKADKPAKADKTDKAAKADKPAKKAAKPAAAKDADEAAESSEEEAK